ncbi:hypothetical protein YC2023_026454 [Brassica napus]
MASSNASWSLLPFDLVENILYKVPVDSLFINLETLALSSLQGPSDITSMIHCDGLLLSECRFDSVDKKLAVWNPFLRQIKWIEPVNSIKGHYGFYGFGYDNVSRDNYKILKFCNKLGYDSVEIYEFKTQLWRSVHYSHAYSWYAWFDEAVSMDGNMYWFAERLNIDKSITKFFILCFDFSREIFKETCCLPFITRDDDWVIPHLSGFGRDRLSLLSKDKYGKIQLWVTNNVTDEIVSWSKYFNMTPPYLPIISCGFFRNMTFFIHKTNMIMLWCLEEDIQNKNIYVNVYEIGEDVVEKQVETERHRWCDQASFRSRCYVFVPSLVPVPE